MNAEMVARFLEALLRSSAQAAGLVVMILLAQRLFRRWLTPHWRCGLWLLVAVRLLLPVSIPTRFSVSNFFPGAAGPEPHQPIAAVSEPTPRQEAIILSGTRSEPSSDF